MTAPIAALLLPLVVAPSLVQAQEEAAPLSFVKSQASLATSVDLIELGALNNENVPGISNVSKSCNNNGTGKRSPLVPCIDLSGAGSALTIFNGSYYGLFDNGPAESCADLAESGYATAQGKQGEGFFLPTMSPTIVKLSGGISSGFEIDVHGSIVLRNSMGEKISARPPPELNVTVYGPGCAQIFGADPEGVDPEDVHHVPGTNWMVLVEEYLPSILVVNMMNGQVLARYVPEGVTLDGANYPVIQALPSVYFDPGRGFESLAVDPANGEWLVTVLQSNLDDESRVHRAIEMRINKSDPTKFSLTKQFVIPGSPVEAYPDELEQADLKMSAGWALSSNRTMILLERATNQVKLFSVDLNSAEDINTMPRFANSLLLEQLSVNQSLPVEAATRFLIWDSKRTIGGSSIDSKKLEGVVPVINEFFYGTTLLLVNDNDFGAGGSMPTQFTEIELGASAFIPSFVVSETDALIKQSSAASFS
jgi:hypothetical protein